MKHKKLKTTESIHKWMTGINSGILKPAPKTEYQCLHCQLLEIKQLQARIKELESDCGNFLLLQIENQRLKWLIANMMTNVEYVKEFEYDK